MFEALRCDLNMDNYFSETEHSWGSPLSIGVFLATTRNNAVGIVVDSLKTEWSLTISKFLEQAIKLESKTNFQKIKNLTILRIPL